MALGQNSDNLRIERCGGMGLINLRKQHAVGQGFFHTGELLENEELRLRYVYDCGAMTKYARARSDRIKSYLQAVGARNKLDLLFISHVHADHLNGLPQLLHAKKGLVVDTIVLPYFDVVERLIGYARDATVDPASVRNAFFRDFVVDPISALSRFEPRQILFVRSAGDDSPGAPNLDGVPDGPGPEIFGEVVGEKGPAWKLVGHGAIEGGRQRVTASSSSEPMVATMPDSIGIAMPSSAATTPFWLLSPFIDPAIARQRGIFKTALLKALNHAKPIKGQIKKRDFDGWLSDPDNRKDLVLNRVSDLSTAYEAVEKNLNISSMCLYSGPLPDGTVRPQRHASTFGKWNAQGDGGIGWLATGDADLKVKRRSARFLKHYRNLLDEVVTLTIPHHGSENNFSEVLLVRVDPCFCIVAADAVGRWRHPGTKIVRAVASHGRFLSVVTSKKISEVAEIVQIN